MYFGFRSFIYKTRMKFQLANNLPTVTNIAHNIEKRFYQNDYIRFLALNGRNNTQNGSKAEFQLPELYFQKAHDS